MKKMTGSEIRKMFLDFFESKGHMIEPGASLIPHEDPTLLWINSGVAAIKKYFDGRVVPKNPRIVNAQKSIRTNDIENVGHTARHHTFFEMLGNFSIGDYFREEAIPFAWELLASPEWFAFDKNLLYVTVYPTDEATYQIWLKLGVDPSHIIKLEENFWEIGAGPCGPCTEIFFDRGSSYDPENTGINLLVEDIENDRYIEIWNVVFSQFNSDPDLERHAYQPLPNQNIDTGMGLERMACVMQDVETNFETDLFMPIIEKIAHLSGSAYEGVTKVSFKIIADHVRTVTFAVADGALLSNEGRGYVLRRLLRRAVRHGKGLGTTGAFLYELVPVVANIMKDYYPTVLEKVTFIQGIIKDEEDRFLKTLAEGEKKFNTMVGASAEQISGTDAFMLYDTYGFPFELTVELAEERGLTVDRDGFEACMEKQKERARHARGEMEGMAVQNEALLNFKEQSAFMDQSVLRGRIMLLLKEGQVVDTLQGEGQLVLDQTPFYATSGGQVADIGKMETSKDEHIEVKDVTKAPHGQFLHTVHTSATLTCDQDLLCCIDALRRRYIERNHTATHLLHQALKDVLGTHANQAGSLVNSDYLRFDFSHSKAMTPDEIKQVEAIVNRFIFRGVPVQIQHMTLAEAKADGAMALFGEKYDADDVRVVTIKDVFDPDEREHFSIELCGGTHVKHTSAIGLFKIISESGIGAGIRRIEAVTSQAAVDFLNNQLGRLTDIATVLKTKPGNLETRVETLLADLSELRRENESLKAQMANAKVADLAHQIQVINGCHVLTARIDGVAMNELKTMIDELKQRLGEVIIVLASAVDDKVVLACGVTADYIERGLNAGKIVKEVAMICGGNGGGRPGLATAGASEASKIEAGFAKVIAMIEENEVKDFKFEEK
ncbi:MAG: alanine--tRNA ligase [Defluviitaleaceae bacterium]|nr:alanine--tRNA ligase [Defluviitaleaceae bacterium]